jgi:3' terminal RNA ribose 2'-O-methyltransferase Hen1
MLLTITTTQKPATDLGYLLHKSPFRVHSFEQVFGKTYVFYPETTDERCTAALLLEIDPIGLVRDRRGPSGDGYALEQYVNDRPYAASSFLSVAIARTFGTAITGKSKERQELANSPLPLEAQISVLPCRGGENLLRRLFEPLGYEVTAARHPLDEKFPEWGESSYYTVGLKGISHKLSHLLEQCSAFLDSGIVNARTFGLEMGCGQVAFQRKMPHSTALNTAQTMLVSYLLFYDTFERAPRFA